MKIDRLLGILNILVEADKVTINELAERFEVSKRTIFRDLDTLNQSGIPIVTYQGKGGGISIVDGYKYNKNIFSKNDIQNIFTALSGLMSIDKSKEIISLLEKIIPNEKDNLFSKSQYLIDLSSWFDDSITQKKINDIDEAIKDNKYISLDYISKSSRKERIIEPYKLVFKQSHWYLYGFCKDKNGFRLFRINRIVSYKILNNSFQRQSIEKFELKNDFFNEYTVFQKSPISYEVMLKYRAEDEFSLTDKIDAKFFIRNSKEEEGKIIFNVDNLECTADFIISLTDKIKVVYPLKLKEIVKLKIENMMGIYKDDI